MVCFLAYIHGEGRIGVLLQAKTSSNSEVVKTLLNDVCMQIAAMNPKYVKLKKFQKNLLLLKEVFY